MGRLSAAGAGPRGPDELVVLTWGGPWERALRTAVSDPFAELTGIRVRHDPHVGLELPGRLVDPIRSGQTAPCHVVWSNAVPAMAAALEGLCDPMTEAEVPNLAHLHDLARPAGFDGWPFAMAYAVLYVLVFRRRLFPSASPESWRVLLEPRHRGRVALYPDGNGIHPVAQLLGGGAVSDIPGDMAPCWRFLRRLRPQVVRLDYSGALADALRAGEVDLCFRALPNAVGFAAAGLDVDWAAPAEGVPDTMDTLWVPRGLPAATAALAKRYIGFALARSRQERWCAMLGTLPAHREAIGPAVLRNRRGTPSTLDEREKVLHVPDAVKFTHHRQWRDEFAAIFGEPDPQRGAGTNSSG